ncbi:MAG: DUF2062 domain-containing protein [Pseudomonadota bacterium]|jgi:uncharacterized protein (DUF2062 family)|nr:DUF2062 domain-containing protein [Pseudomonadota bacterium]
MPKKLFKRLFPSPEQVKRKRSLRFLSPLFSKPNLWHVNRRAVARAFLIGVFTAFLPLPFQMGIAAFLAFYINANVPISIGLVWISNPVTIPPIFYFTYLLGSELLGVPPGDFTIELSWHWVLHELSRIWAPLFVGSLTAGIILAVLAYFTMHLVWRAQVIHNWKQRKLKRQRRDASES